MPEAPVEEDRVTVLERRLHDLARAAGELLRPFAAGLTMYASVRFLALGAGSSLPGPVLLLQLVVAGAMIYPALMWLIDRRSVTELVALTRSR